MRLAIDPSMMEYFRKQIIANCSFLHALDSADTKIDIISSKIDIVSSKDEKGLWHAHVIHFMNATLEDRLSESGQTLYEALHALLERSSRNVSNFRKACRQDMDSDNESDTNDDEDKVLDGDDADMNLDDDVSVWNDGSCDPDQSDDESDDEMMPAGINRTSGLSVPPPFIGSIIAVAQRNSPAVSYDDRAARGVRIPDQPQTANKMMTTARAATSPPPRLLQVEYQGPSEAQTPTSAYHVRLTISVATTGATSESPPTHIVTTIARPTLHALLGAAISHIRTNPATAVAGETQTLRAQAKRVKIGSSMWDLGGYRADDISIFFAPSPNGIALTLFEIEVEYATGLSGTK